MADEMPMAMKPGLSGESTVTWIGLLGEVVDPDESEVTCPWLDTESATSVAIKVPYSPFWNG